MKTLEQLNIDLKDRTPQSIISWAKESFSKGLIMTSAFGASGMVLIHMIKDICPEIPILFLNTGFHFPETLEFLNRIQSLWDIRVIELKPAMSKEDLFQKLGPKPYENHQDQCCHVNKVLPLEKAFHDFQVKAWITALRKDQSISRQNLEVITTDHRGILKINPLVYWTRKDIWAYLFENKVPYHPLHDKNYPSIGCAPCTQPTGDGSHERDGRWVGKDKLECGIHVAPSREAVDLDEVIDIDRQL